MLGEHAVWVGGGRRPARKCMPARSHSVEGGVPSVASSHGVEGGTNLAQRGLSFVENLQAVTAAASANALAFQWLWLHWTTASHPWQTTCTHHLTLCLDENKHGIHQRLTAPHSPHPYPPTPCPFSFHPRTLSGDLTNMAYTLPELTVMEER